MNHPHDQAPGLPWLLRLAFVLMLGAAAMSPVQAQDAAALKARHAELQERLANNAFGRPLALESAQTSGDLKGDIYSVIDHPFTMLQQALRPAEHWCDVLILHLNVKGCKATGSPGASQLALAVGKKFDQPAEDAYHLEFTYKVAAASADYLQIQLNADEGPLGTRDYRIRLEAVPLDARHSFIHMSYSYGYGFAARMAMKAYLATIGRDKVGFSQLERKPDGKPAYVGGVLGLVERNTMRYYLAIDSYLGAYSLPPGEQVERRIHAWHAATERYATQLHEMDQAEYIEMKRNEIRRQKKEAQ
ncbi:MAG: hypothetical protein M3Y67_10745 [Pseudomonadota bacterium]|nr:hypothetical protein [Pseudomonadota bacterium]